MKSNKYFLDEFTQGCIQKTHSYMSTNFTNTYVYILLENWPEMAGNPLHFSQIRPKMVPHGRDMHKMTKSGRMSHNLLPHYTKIKKLWSPILHSQMYSLQPSLKLSLMKLQLHFNPHSPFFCIKISMQPC